MPKTRRVAITALVVVVAIAALFFWRAVFRYVSGGWSRPSAITISRETTYLTEPVREDGTIDYLAAINQQCSAGVTPENNASVLLWQALGPKACSSPYPQKFFKLLGMPAPPPEGEYFIPFEEWQKRKRGADSPTDGESQDDEKDADEFDVDGTRPWTRDEFPQLAEWLDANEKPLALVIEATRRPKRYDPRLDAKNVPLLAADISLIGEARYLCRALDARALLWVSEGRIADAWQDLLALQRLARLVAQGRTLVDEAVGASIATVASQAERIILQNTQLRHDELHRMRLDLDQLPATRINVDTLDQYERFALLDSICVLARESSHAKSTTGKSSDRIDRRLLKTAGKAFLDWNLVLRTENRWWDQLVFAYRIENRAEREAAVSAVNKSLAKTIKEAKRTGESLKGWLHPQQSVSDWVAYTLLEMFHPAASAPIAHERAQIELDMTRLAFALAEFRAERGVYPESLAELVPGYVEGIPNDIFADAPPEYETKDGGYILRSDGPKYPRDEFAEDAAESDEEGEEDQSITVRMPAEP